MGYKFDGKNLKNGSKTVANVRGDKICEGTGSSVIANIRGDKICQGTGSTVMFNLRGENICQGTGTSKVATMSQVDDDIDGPGNVVKAALWICCVR